MTPKSLGCQTIGIVSSNSHFSIVHRIEAELYSVPEPIPELKHILIDKTLEPEIFKKEAFCMLVVIGAEALQSVLKTHSKKPILVLLTRKNIINQLIQENSLNNGITQNNISAIYLDQPLERQLNLVKAIVPQTSTNNSVGVLLGPSSVQDKDKLSSIAKQQNIQLNSIYVNKFENPVGVLDTLLDDVNALLAMPDNRIFNPKTTRGMLLTAFHKRVPLFGYSKTYVNNGALAAIYSTNKQIAHQAANEILAFIKNGKKLDIPKYPTDFAVAVNYQVSRSLGITVDSEAALQYKLYIKENRQQLGGICAVTSKA
jgi:putative ABC transport system substrate-binding protein